MCDVFYFLKLQMTLLIIMKTIHQKCLCQLKYVKSKTTIASHIDLPHNIKHADPKIQ